jgi:release factor glutamine methyltransferase
MFRAPRQMPVLRSLDDHLRRAAARLAGLSPTPRLDAEVLLGQATGLSRAGLYLSLKSSLPLAQADRLETLLARRLLGEPIAYITGFREFWSMQIALSGDTLIPRPETETLVAKALSLIPREACWSVADLGTGAGAVALAIARERPQCRVLATDISPGAIEVAKKNAARLGVGNVEFALGDWLAPLGQRRAHAIVANPPYVPAGDWHLASGDVRFEPRLALEAGVDGLRAIRRIAADARRHLLEGGWLALEHGWDQAGRVRELLLQCGYADVECHQDLAGLDRVTLGRWPCEISAVV